MRYSIFSIRCVSWETSFEAPGVRARRLLPEYEHSANDGRVKFGLHPLVQHTASCTLEIPRPRPRPPVHPIPTSKFKLQYYKLVPDASSSPSSQGSSVLGRLRSGPGPCPPLPSPPADLSCRLRCWEDFEFWTCRQVASHAEYFALVRAWAWVSRYLRLGSLAP